LRNLKIKVCGMRERDNILEIAKLKPDYMGFIFYKASKRYVGEKFKLENLDPSIKKVGVFVNQSKEEVLEITNAYGLQVIQLHGTESPEFCSVIKAAMPKIDLWKVFSIGNAEDFASLSKYEKVCDKYLFDTKTEEFGGSGKSFDWQFLQKYTGKKDFLLAGGVSEETAEIAKTIRQQNILLHAIDVNSRVEIEPGVKSVDKILQLLKILEEK